MGWTSTEYRWGSFKEFMEEEFNGERHQILDYALINRSEVYAAYRITPVKPEQKPFVIGLVVLVKWYSQGRGYRPDICWKEMTEDMGPGYHRCPERILNLLSPIEDFASGDSAGWAREWRERCRTRIKQGERWRKLKVGDVIKSLWNLSFSDGRRRNLFMVEDKKRLWFREVMQEFGGKYVLGGRVKIRRDSIKDGFMVVGHAVAEKITLTEEV